MIFAGGAHGGADPVKATGKGWLIWVTAALFYLYEFLVRVAPSAMEPELQGTFHLTAAALSGAMAAYYWIYSPMQLLAGSFMDRFGAKQVLMPAALIVTAGCFVEVIGHEAGLLTLARFLQGFGSAFAFVGTMYLAAEWFPRSMLALLSGLTTSLGMAGAIVGNAGVASVVETLSWRTALIAAGVLGIVITVLIFFIVPKEGKKRHERAKEVELDRGPGVFKALKIVYSNPQSWYAGIIGTALYMPLSVLGALWGEEYIMNVTGEDKLAASGAVSMLYVGWMIGGPVAGWFSDRTGRRQIMLLGAGIATLVCTLGVALVPNLSLPFCYALMLILGLASCSQVVCFVAAVEHNPPFVAGTAIAATNMMIMLLGGIGEWAFGMILDVAAGGGTAGATAYPEEAYRKAILLLPVISAIGVAAAYFLRESFQKAVIPPGPEAIM